MNNFQPLQRQSKVFMVIMLYNLTTLNFAFNWSCRTSAFIGNGQKFTTIYQELIKPIPVDPFGTRITATICTIISNTHMVRKIPLNGGLYEITDQYYQIWCCWVVWQRRWIVVLLPALFLTSGTGMVAGFSVFLSTHHLPSAVAHRTVHQTRKRNFPDIQYPLYILQLVDNLMVHVTDHLPHFYYCSC